MVKCEMMAKLNVEYVRDNSAKLTLFYISM